jgi:hypothetical protein
MSGQVKFTKYQEDGFSLERGFDLEDNLMLEIYSPKRQAAEPEETQWFWEIERLGDKSGNRHGYAPTRIAAIVALGVARRELVKAKG